jgi:hypothetical protein
MTEDEAQFLVQTNNEFMIFYGTIVVTSVLGMITVLTQFKDFKNATRTLSLLYFILVGGLTVSVSELLNLFRGNYIIISSGYLGNSTEWLKHSTNYTINSITIGWPGVILTVVLAILAFLIFFILYKRKKEEASSNYGKNNKELALKTVTGNQMALGSHRLCLTVETPKIVTEGENFHIVYKISNRGSAPYPGGVVNVEISWNGVDAKVYQPIVIDKRLEPNEEFKEKKYSQTPLIAGYTWFHVYQASSSDGLSVIVVNPTDAQIFPYQTLQVSPTAITYFRQPAHAVRARTHEEFYTYWGLWAAVGSLVVIAIFQAINWLIQFHIIG